MITPLTSSEITQLCDHDEDLGIYTLDFSFIPSIAYSSLFAGLHRFLERCGPALILRCSSDISSLHSSQHSLQSSLSISSDPECHRFVRWLMRILRHSLHKNHQIICLGLCNLPPFNVVRFLGSVIDQSQTLRRLILKRVPLDADSFRMLLLFVSPFRYEELRLPMCELGDQHRLIAYRYLKRGLRSSQLWTLLVFDVSENEFSQRDLEKFDELLGRRIGIGKREDFDEDPAQDGEEEDRYGSRVGTLSEERVDQFLADESSVGH
jgi:hypothetical protein